MAGEIRRMLVKIPHETQRAIRITFHPHGEHKTHTSNHPHTYWATDPATNYYKCCRAFMLWVGLQESYESSVDYHPLYHHLVNLVLLQRKRS